jgi:predicted MFS family arabinose efflux permease
MSDAATAAPVAPVLLADMKRHRTYALAILTLAYTSNYLDRSIVGILAEPIRKELGLSDTELGLMTGFAFAMFYATLGIPIALLSDRTNRRNIIAVAIAVWSAMTALCGMAQNYPQLLLARIGVGIGEAGASPPSHSMIADMYAPHERSRALAVYSLGVYIGGMLGFLIGAWVSTIWGWRAAFFVVGMPGLLIALLVWFTVKEPQRGLADGIDPTQRKKQTLTETLAGLGDAFLFIWRSKACRHIVIGVTLTSFVGYGGVMWAAPFLERSFGIPRLQVGVILGPIVGVLGGFGVLLGGYLADRLSKRHLRWNAWIIGLAKFAAAPLILAFYLTADFNTALMFYFPAVVLGAFYLGPSFAIVQSVGPLAMRATLAAIMLFILNFIALGFGPLAVGVASDLLKPTFGAESLRYALMGTSFINIWAGIHFMLAGSAYAREMNKASQTVV